MFATMPETFLWNVGPLLLVGRVVFLCIVQWNQTELLSAKASLMHLFSLVSFCLNSFTNSMYFFLLYGHLLLYLSMIDSVSYWADCLRQYIKIINIYILNVKLGMPVFYTSKVVSYLLVSKLKRWASQSANTD